MPIRHLDPFVPIKTARRTDANPYISKFSEAAASKTLPICAGPDLMNYVGRWRERIEQYYKTSKQHLEGLVVEIGCHTGQALVQMAADHPNQAFVGVDITFKRVVKSAERAVDHGLKNVFCILADAKFLEKLFPDQELTGVVARFPDPWKKKKKEKNRLFSRSFCVTLFENLKPEGFVWYTTDEQAFFEETCGYMSEVGFLEQKEPVFIPDMSDIRNTRDISRIGDSERYPSVFSRHFEREGTPVFERVWEKPKISIDIKELSRHS